MYNIRTVCVHETRVVFILFLLFLINKIILLCFKESEFEMKK